MTLQEFIHKYTGVPVDFDGRYGNQCVDLARQYVKEVLKVPQFKPVVGAADMCTSYDPKYFNAIKNTPDGVPQPGDIMIWNKRAGGGYGHVGIFSHGDVNEFWSFDQNWPPGSLPKLVRHTYSNLYGWLRPVSNDITPTNGGNTPSEPSESVTVGTEFKNIEQLPKDSVISDIYQILTGVRPTEDEMKWRLESGKNLVEIGEDIATGDGRFDAKWKRDELAEIADLNFEMNAKNAQINSLRENLADCRGHCQFIPVVESPNFEEEPKRSFWKVIKDFVMSISSK